VGEVPAEVTYTDGQRKFIPFTKLNQAAKAAEQPAFTDGTRKFVPMESLTGVKSMEDMGYERVPTMMERAKDFIVNLPMDKVKETASGLGKDALNFAELKLDDQGMVSPASGEPFSDKVEPHETPKALGQLAKGFFDNAVKGMGATALAYNPHPDAQAAVEGMYPSTPREATEGGTSVKDMAIDMIPLIDVIRTNNKEGFVSATKHFAEKGLDDPVGMLLELMLIKDFIYKPIAASINAFKKKQILAKVSKEESKVLAKLTPEQVEQTTALAKQAPEFLGEAQVVPGSGVSGKTKGLYGTGVPGPGNAVAKVAPETVEATPIPRGLYGPGLPAAEVAETKALGAGGIPQKGVPQKGLEAGVNWRKPEPRTARPAPGRTAAVKALSEKNVDFEIVDQSVKGKADRVGSAVGDAITKSRDAGKKGILKKDTPSQAAESKSMADVVVKKRGGVKDTVKARKEAALGEMEMEFAGARELEQQLAKTHGGRKVNINEHGEAINLGGGKSYPGWVDAAENAGFSKQVIENTFNNINKGKRLSPKQKEALKWMEADAYKRSVSQHGHPSDHLGTSAPPSTSPTPKSTIGKRRYFVNEKGEVSTKPLAPKPKTKGKQAGYSPTTMSFMGVQGLYEGVVALGKRVIKGKNPDIPTSGKSYGIKHAASGKGKIPEEIAPTVRNRTGDGEFVTREAFKKSKKLAKMVRKMPKAERAKITATANKALMGDNEAMLSLYDKSPEVAHHVKGLRADIDGVVTDLSNELKHVLKTKSMAEQKQFVDAVLRDFQMPGKAGDATAIPGVAGSAKVVDSPFVSEIKALFGKVEKNAAGRTLTPDQLLKKMEENLGSYVRRKYMINMVKSYKPSRALWDKTVKAVVADTGKSVDDAKAFLEGLLKGRDLIKSDGGLELLISKSPYKARTNIPEYLRDFLGEIKDPGLNHYLTMKDLVANTTKMKIFREMAGNKKLFFDSPKPGGAINIGDALKVSERADAYAWGSIANKYTTV